MAPLYSLRLLGGVILEGPSGPLSGRVTQRRQLALLALLATARTGGVSREKVLGLLWPENSEKQARHYLSDALWTLRDSLGEDAIVSSGDTVSLNPSVIRSDLATFREALHHGDLAAAVDRYDGPFLDGFYLSDNRDFEGWVESERQHLGSQFANVLESLADQAEEDGDYRQALGWWRRLTAHDPYDSRIAVRLMRALAIAGDPANALKYAREHEVLLKQELGIEPPVEVRQLVERLRRSEDMALDPQRTYAGARHPTETELGQPEKSATLATASVPGLRTLRQTVPGHRRQLVRRAMLVVVPVAVLGLGTWVVTSSRKRARDRRSIAVLPCDAMTGDTTRGLLADRWTEERSPHAGAVSPGSD
jgi:DNA-binding SARP family transcriptional activator